MSTPRSWLQSGRWAWLPFLGLCGCQPAYERLDLRVASGEGRIHEDEIEVVEGRVVLVHADPIAAGAFEYERFDVLELESLDPDLVFVEGAREMRAFVVGGARVGEGRIQVRINRREVDTLWVQVVSQEAP